MELRPYQKEAKEAIFEQWDSGVLKTLLVLPTGCGKTVVFAKVTEECVRKGDRVLILAHRGELLDQAADKLMKTTGLGCALEKAESSCQGSWFRVVVGSVQTLMREKRLGSFPADYFNTIIIDEAHHCISDSYQRVLQHFPEAQVLGVTATPDRGDMRNLGVYFESLAYEYTLPKAIKEGYLSPIKALTIPLKIDMSNVSVQAGDFKARYSQINWEYESKETAVHIAQSLLGRNQSTGEPVYPAGKKRLYRAVEYNTGVVDKPFMDTFSPDIRDISYFNGWNHLMRMIEFDCNLAYGTISDPNNTDKTAEEIKASKQRSYSFVQSCQTALQHALEDLVDAIAFWCDLYHLCPSGTYQTSFDWDDSIVTDVESERQSDRLDVSMGAMPLWEYRMKWYGETEEQAKAAVQQPEETVIE